jgi:hypothetical protein
VAVTQADPTYEKVRKKLSETVKGEAEAVTTGDFGKDVTQTFGATDATFQKVHEVFSREALQTKYTTKYDNRELGDGEAVSIRLQGEVISGVEKAVQIRRLKRLDIMVSGVSRARGMTVDTGYLNHALKQVPFIGGGA